MTAVYSRTTVNIHLEEGALNNLSKFLDLEKRYFVITDQTVYYFYGKILEQLLNYDVFIMMAGEDSKNMATVMQICQEMLEKGYGKSDVIITLGGGVVGDIGGFVASIYKRGIDYINIPTSLIAQVDSAIGGKVGVNCAGYKNQIGSIYHPSQIIIDFNALSTLAKSEISSGMGEIFKYAILFDKEMFNELKIHKYNLPDLIKRCIMYKVEITTADEFDLGVRNLLNFGHTVGHAIEAKYHLSHGQSIAYGMYLESKNEEIHSLLLSYGLDFSYSFTDLKEYILQDKKRQGKKIKKIKILAIGQAILEDGEIDDYFK